MPIYQPYITVSILKFQATVQYCMLLYCVSYYEPPSYLLVLYDQVLSTSFLTQLIAAFVTRHSSADKVEYVNFK